MSDKPVSDSAVERRALLRGAGLAGAAALGATAFAPSAFADGNKHHGGSRSGVVGAWVVTHRDNPPGDTTTVTGVAAFAEGGVLVSQDIAPMTTPAAVGAWSSSDHEVSVNFWTGGEQEGDHQGGTGGPGGPGGHRGVAVAIHVTGTGTVSGDTISGTYSFTVYNAKTGRRLMSGTGTFRGTRLTAGSKSSSSSH